MTYNKIINEEIENPIQNHVSSAACRIPKKLLGKQFLEGFIEEIYNFCNKIR